MKEKTRAERDGGCDGKHVDEEWEGGLMCESRGAEYVCPTGSADVKGLRKIDSPCDSMAHGVKLSSQRESTEAGSNRKCVGPGH